MALFRALVILGLLAGLVCFGLYVWTGEARWRRRGLRVVSWSVGSALAFFAVLFVLRIFEMM